MHKLAVFVGWEESTRTTQNEHSHSASAIVAKEMLYQSRVSAWCTRATHFTLGVRSVCKRNFQSDYRQAWLASLYNGTGWLTQWMVNFSKCYNFKQHLYKQHTQAGHVCWLRGVNHSQCRTNKPLSISNFCQEDVVPIMDQSVMY